MSPQKNVFIRTEEPQNELEVRTISHGEMPEKLPEDGRRMRAIDAADKEARRASILDAADTLFMQTHELANVAEVAKLAGLAKGTVYLYFQTKEEMYLALQLRNAGAFFHELIEDLERPCSHPAHQRIDFDYMKTLVLKHMFDNATYFPLGACCAGFMRESVPVAMAQATVQQMGTWLSRAGAGLEQHFPQLKPGEGIRLLNHSYALMIGLHRLLGANNFIPQCPAATLMGSFRDEAMIALERYWHASLNTPISD